MKPTKNIYLLERGENASYAVQFKAAGQRYWRLFTPQHYGTLADALEVATRVRDHIQTALDAGADAAWLFYIYGGADRPASSPKNFIW